MKNGAAILGAVIYLLSPVAAFAAITFQDSNYGTPSGSPSLAVTNGGTDAFIVACFSGTGDNVVSAAYNGTALSKAGYQEGNSHEVYDISVWTGPIPSGSGSVTASLSSGSDGVYAAIYSGVVGGMEEYVPSTGEGSPATVTFTPADAGDWGVLCGADNGSGGTMQGNTTQREQSAIIFADSGGPLDVTNTIGYTYTGGSYWSNQGVSLSPASGGGGGEETSANATTTPLEVLTTSWLLFSAWFITISSLSFTLWIFTLLA